MSIQRKLVMLCEFDQAYADGRHHEANRMLFEWLADDDDRAELFHQLRDANRKLLPFPSITRLEIDPAPPLTEPPFHGHRTAYLVLDRGLIETILKDRNGRFLNRPYRAIGSGGFMLGLDPGAQPGGQPHPHAVQRQVAENAVQPLETGKTMAEQAARLCELAIEQAGVIALARRRFDLADFAEQAGLRYCELLMGFAMQDHALLQDALARSYRALNYQMLGRHFLHEPGTIESAQVAMAQLARRIDELMRDYDMRVRYPEDPASPFNPRPERELWPHGVSPPASLGLSGFEPLLMRWARSGGDPLSAAERSSLAVGMLAGIVGNLQAAVCIAVEAILRESGGNHIDLATDEQSLSRRIGNALALNPPAPFLPRSYAVVGSPPVCHEFARIEDGSDLVLCLGAASHQPPQGSTGYDPLVFGLPPEGLHNCLGASLVWPLIVAVTRHVLRLPGIARCIDPVDSEPVRLRKRWGFGCESLPLQYRRDRLRVQQPLQVVMRIKTPVAENAARLRQLIRDSAPRIDLALREAAHVHFAWFQLVDSDTQLVLQTVYDGDFDAYIYHFAFKVDDVFDGLFRFIEDAPPLPVRHFPEAFVETIRRYNRAPAGGYFFSAYPRSETPVIQAAERRAGP